MGNLAALEIEALGEATRAEACRIVADRWGSTVIVSRGVVHNLERLPGFVAKCGELVQGLVTYHCQAGECEVVSLDSFVENKGVGGLLLDSVVATAKSAGCRRVWLITTNDNVRAIRYYQKRGFNMKSLHRNAIEVSRSLKPEIPIHGSDGIPILHELEFELVLPAGLSASNAGEPVR